MLPAYVHNYNSYSAKGTLYVLYRAIDNLITDSILDIDPILRMQTTLMTVQTLEEVGSAITN